MPVACTCTVAVAVVADAAGTYLDQKQNAKRTKHVVGCELFRLQKQHGKRSKRVVASSRSNRDCS